MIIIADISGNHGGHLTKAKELIQEAARCGCDFAKFQYYHPGDMYATSKAEMDLYRELAVPHAWLGPLFDCASSHSIRLFASVFSVDGLMELLPFSPHYFKFASPLSTWLPHWVYEGMAEAASEAHIPIIASTDENSRAKVQGLYPDFLFFCPPAHPYTVTDHDLCLFHQGDYNGFSDHSPSLGAPLAFAGVGAQFIEKHLKLDDNCVDAAFSATPATMGKLCQILK